MRRASQVVALFNFNRSGLSIFLSQYVAQTSRRQRPGLCRYPGRFRVEHAAPLRCVSPCYFPAPRRLLTALTPASTTAPMIKPSTRLATTGSVEAITPPNPAPSARWHDAAAQYRERQSPADEEHGQRPDDRQHLHQAGATARSPLPSHCASALRFSASQ